MKKFTFILAIFICYISYSQEMDTIIAFNDNNGFFFGYEKGKLVKLESLPVKQFEYSRLGLVYIDNQGDLYIKKAGEKKERLEFSVNLFYLTDNLLAYQTASILRVYEGGKSKNICLNTGKFYASDSLVIFEDNMQITYNIYYKDSIQMLERGIFDDPTYQRKIGKNILVYKNTQNWYKAFYRGELIEIGAFNEDIDFQVGRNILGFNHPFDQNFQAFYFGDLVLLEDQPAQEYKAGDELLAYKDYQGNLKVYYKDQIHLVSSYEPDWFEVRDSLVVFQENGMLRVFDAGEVYTIENFIPTVYKYRYRDLVYTDQSGASWLFRRGERHLISSEWSVAYWLSNGCILVEFPNKRYGVYANGELIRHQ